MRVLGERESVRERGREGREGERGGKRERERDKNRGTGCLLLLMNYSVEWLMNPLPWILHQLFPPPPPPHLLPSGLI